MRRRRLWADRLLRGAGAAMGIAALLFGLLPVVECRDFHTGVAVLLTVGAATLWAALCPPGKRGRVWKTVTLLLLMAFAGGAALTALMLPAASRAPAGDSPRTVVVLGGLIEDGEPSRLLRGRLDAALRYLAEDPQAPVVVAGGPRKGESITEAEAMRRYLVSRGAKESRIFLEDASRNTRQNMENTAALLKEAGLPDTIVVVTDRFHQFRGQTYAKRSGLTVAGACSSDTPWELAPAYWVREFFALGKVLLGW